MSTPQTPAQRAIAANAHANRQQAARDARELAQAELAAQRARRADTTTPLTGAMMPTDELPDLPGEREQAQTRSKPTPLVLSVTILWRGRMITIASEGRSLDQFCDLLDDRLGVAQ